MSINPWKPPMRIARCGATRKRRAWRTRSHDWPGRPPISGLSGNWLGHLLEFHRREDKPSYWVMFHRQELSEEELIEDAECIGALRPDPSAPPYADKRSKVYTFRFPPQDFKMRMGHRPKRAASLKDAGEIVFLDEEAGQIALKIGPKAEPYEEAFSLIPQGPRSRCTAGGDLSLRRIADLGRP